MMPPSTQEITKTVFSVIADTEEVSWIFYLVAAFQITIFSLGFIKSMRQKRWYVFITAVAILAFPAILFIGI